LTLLRQREVHGDVSGAALITAMRLHALWDFSTFAAGGTLFTIVGDLLGQPDQVGFEQQQADADRSGRESSHETALTVLRGGA
jgi:hypothetical protein